MRYIITALLVIIAHSARADTGLIFPSDNTVGVCQYIDNPGTDESVAFKWDDPHLNGLHWWGPADAGVTYMWEYKPDVHAGYRTTFFYSRGDGEFDSPGYQMYYGAHPIPRPAISGWGGGAGTDPEQYWEIAGMLDGNDEVRTGEYDHGNPLVNGVLVDQTGTWFQQAFVVEGPPGRVGASSDIGTGEHLATFYFQLQTGMGHDDYIQFRAVSSYGTATPTDPILYWGNDPWCFNNEKMAGTFRNLKIWDRALTDSEIAAQAGVDTQILKSVDSNIWYHNPNPTPSDILDKSGGTAHDPNWASSSRPTLYDTGTPAAVPTFMGTLITGGSIQ